MLPRRKSSRSQRPFPFGRVFEAADGVLSVGGFLGMGTRMVAIRYDSLKFADNKIVLPGATKDGLKMLPAFQYSKE